MKLKTPLIVGLAILCFSTTQVFATSFYKPSPSQAYNTSYWTNNDGGIFNVPPEEYNPTYHGYGSSGQVVYNKIDLQTGAAMEIAGDTALHDNRGNKIGTARPSKIGYYDGQRDGGIIAGAVTKLKIGGTTTEVAYVWSVNIKEGGRKSGWVDINKLTPTADIRAILVQTAHNQTNLILSNLQQGQYTAKTVQAAYLPSEAAEWYLTAGRDASKAAGKAKYYFTRDNLISGIKNIPETGRQRYGVAHDVAPTGATFYMDKRVPQVSLDIFPPSSTTPSGHKLKLVWGYFNNNASRKVFSWVNADALR